MYRSHDVTWHATHRFARFDTIPLPLSLRSLARARRAIARHSRHARREPRLTRGATSPSVLYEWLLSPGGTRRVRTHRRSSHRPLRRLSTWPWPLPASNYSGNVYNASKVRLESLAKNRTASSPFAFLLPPSRRISSFSIPRSPFRRQIRNEFRRFQQTPLIDRVFPSTYAFPGSASNFVENIRRVV